MNPSVAIDEKPHKLPRDDERPQQKLHSALKTNVKSLKQGLRSVMNGNRHGKPTGPSLKEKADKDKPTPEDSDATETDELNLEDVETVPHGVDDKKEDSMNESDQLSNSFHNQEGQQPLVWQDSPRAPQELMGTSNATSKPSRNVPRRAGSDPNLHRNEETLSELAAPSMDGGFLHSQSAPQHPLTPGISPCGRNTPTSKNSKFLRGKIKISALKNFVGAGIDMGSSSNNHVGKSHQMAHEDDTVDHSRRRQDDPLDEFASPHPMAMGPGRKIANKMRSSILGFKNLAKANRNAAVLLDDDTASGSLNDLNGARDYELKDVFDIADSDAAKSDPTRATSPLPGPQDDAMEEGASTMAADNLVQEKDEAKQRRREKHHKRRKQMEGGGGGDSNHAGNESTLSSSGPPLQRKNTKGKLDASARERLKKHSEGRDFRNRTTTANRRRRHSLASKTSERHLDTSDGMSDLPDLVPAIPSKHATRPSLARVDGQQSSSRKLSEAQSGRKHNKEEGDRHRGRARSRQSLIAGQGTKSDPTLGPKRELSISVLDLQDKKDEDDDRSASDDIHESSSTILEDSGDSVEEVLEKDRSSKSTGYMADSSTQHNTTSGLNASSPYHFDEGCFQHIESHRSDDYLQLIIRNVPAKASSPSPSKNDEAEEGGAITGSVPIHRAGSPRRDRRLSRRASRRGLTDETPDLRRKGSTEPPLRRKGSGRVQKERREPSSRRKPRTDKSTRTRDRSLYRRKSETNAQRRTRRGLTRSDADHESEPVLSAALGSENAGASPAEQNGNAEASSCNPLDGSTSVTGLSAKAYEGHEAADLDESANDNADGNDPSPALPDASAEVSVAPSEVSNDCSKEPPRRHGHDGKESRRRHHNHKPAKDKRADRKTAKAHTPSKHGNSTSSSKQPKHRSSVRGRADGALKKDPSFRGRSEKPRRDSRSSIERRERRHSTDARKRPSLGSECDIRSMKSEVTSAPNTKSGSNNGLSKIKW